VKLKSQLLWVACGAALVCGGAGTRLLESRSARRGAELLDRELNMGELALEREWTLRRAAQRSSYYAIARQTYFRAYLLAKDRAQMSYFAEATRRAGADDVLISDAAGNVLAAAGAEAQALSAIAHALDIGADGELVAVGGKLLDAFRLPVGGAGFLLAGSRVEATALRNQIEPFGLEVALGAGNVMVTTLPAGAELQVRASLAKAKNGAEERFGAATYRVRATRFGAGRRLIAIPLSRVGALTTETSQLVALLLGLILAVVGGGAVIVMNRVIGPMADLERAAERLGAGDLASASRLASASAKRGDEIGALARAFAAATSRLADLATSSAELSQNIGHALAVVDRSATTVARGAGHQVERLRDLESSFTPLTKALEAAASGLSETEGATHHLASDLDSLERVMTGAVSSAERAAAVVSSAEQSASHDGSRADAALLRACTRINLAVDSLKTLLEQQRAQLTAVGTQMRALGDGLEKARSIQVSGRQRGAEVLRAIAEVGRIAHGHGEEATALRRSADALRRDARQLQEALAVLTWRG
jgi:methyl-accepting chemotaxis protein